jgi:tetraacyldisaccharide 4'-kinase
LARRTGASVVAVGRSRVDVARHLLERFPDTQVIVSDDGLQHLALQRDLEVCVFDDQGLGNGWLLPAGPMREAWPRPVDLQCCMPVNTRRLQATGPTGGLRQTLCAPTVARRLLSSFAGHPVSALAGIAHPERFFDMLRAAGLVLGETVALPDHYDFDSEKRIFGERLQDLFCTEKDAVKLWMLGNLMPGRCPWSSRWSPRLPGSMPLLDAKLSSRDGPQTS